MLFVGRLIPNKRPDNLIRFFHAYQRAFNPRSRLILAGSYGGFEQLPRAAARARRRGWASSDVHILGQVTNEELTALYDVADVFLCASEHEGFCVPLVEAFYKRVPVVAYAATAVPATMDGGGVLFDTTRPARGGGADGRACSRTRPARTGCWPRRTRRSHGCVAQDFAAMLLRFVEQVLCERRARPPAAVASDFWRQFQLADELEEIRETRPSAFHALPLAPTTPGPSPIVEHAPMIVNQWVPAAHRRRRGRRPRARDARPVPRRGATSRRSSR